MSDVDDDVNDNGQMIIGTELIRRKENIMLLSLPLVCIIYSPLVI